MRIQECKEIFARLSEYLDQSLPPDMCEQIERHIAGCAPCEEFVESLRRTVELLRQYGPGPAPGPLHEQARSELLAAFRRLRKT